MNVYERIISENQTFIDETWEKIAVKMKVVAPKNKDMIPYTARAGKAWEKTIPEGWTNGFWPGIMWLMYVATKDDMYKDIAIKAEEMLEPVAEDFDYLHHDVGFMWHISSGVHYRLLGDKKAKSRAMYMAASLASRYNMGTGTIRAFPEQEREKMVIVDSMMNIPLLYWASRETKDPRFSLIAQSHADTTMRNHIRPDGSVYHILDYDIHTGELVGPHNGQGYDKIEGSWTRGQSWALYGFALSYLYTGRKEYLDTAKKVAHYFIACVSETDYVPQYDFRQPLDCEDIDTSAGAIAACGLIEIAKLVPESEKALYLKAAIRIIKALTERYCDWTLEHEPILKGCAESYLRLNVPIIFGEYYYIEALYKLKGFEPLFW